MKRKCRDCGKVFEVEPGKTQYLCSDCYKRTKSSGVLRERVCKMCGSTFLGYPRSFYCPACSLERRREQSRANRKNGTARLDRKAEAWYNIRRSKYNIAVYCGDGKRRARERPFFFCA